MHKTKLTDGQLLSQYKNGNEEAFAVLLERHKDRVFTTIYLIVKDRYQAEDLMQDAFIKAIKTIKAGKYNEEGSFFRGCCALLTISRLIISEKPSAILKS